MNQASPYLLPLLANGLACAVGLAVSWLTLWRARRLLLLPLSVATFLLTNGVFQAVPLVLPVDVPFPTAPLLYARSAIAHSILVAVAVLPLLLLAQSRRSTRTVQPPKVAALVPLTVAGLGMACVAYFILRNLEILPMSAAIYRTGSYEDYIAARILVGEIVMGKNFGGNGFASIAFGFLCPAALALIPLTKSLSAGIRRFLLVAAWLTMAIPSVLLGARLMLLFTFVYPLVLWSYGRFAGSSLLAWLRGSWKNILIWLVCISVSVAIFQSAVKSTLLEAVFLLVARVFVAPGAVSGGYYLLFPDLFDFRGAAGVFMMPIASDTVDFSMISIAATGYDSHANASFLATAYSAAGYWGVLAVSLVLVTGCFLVDSFLLRLNRRLASLIVFSNLFGILSISSVAFRVSTITHAYILGPALVILLLGLARHLRSARPAAAPTNSIEGRLRDG